MKDHLGNTRVTFGGHSNGQPELMQTTEYYPFGLVMNQQNYFADGVLSNKYLYNGKELQDDELAGNKLDWYDYGARFYDPQLGRWHSVDPMADEEPGWSPYRYGFNNPIIFIDPNGMLEDWFENELTGDVYYNSSMKKGDEGTGVMEGEGWKHMGENGMFGTDDNSVIEDNKNLATDFKTTGPEYTTEASFEGGNGQKMMKEQGSDFKPTQQIRYKSSLTWHPPSGVSTTTGELTYITEKSKYISNKAIENSEKWIGAVSGNIGSAYVARYQISYTTNTVKKGMNSLMPLIGIHDQRIPQVYPNLKAYPKNNTMINEFIMLKK